MIDNEKLAIDEERRLAQHEAVKGEIRNDVHQEIAHNSELTNVGERERVDELAGHFKHQAINEVADTEVELARGRQVARVSQVIDYLFGLIYGIIAIEIVLELLGARDSSGFKQFIDTISAPLLAPFRGLLANPSVGHSQFMFSYIIALVIYLLLHLAINGLLRLFVHKKTAV